MKENGAEAQQALERMLKYLEDRYGDQAADLRDVDSKTNIRLTVLGGILGAVIVALRAVEGAHLYLLVGGVLVVLAFGFAYTRALWLALIALEVKFAVPGVEPGSFKTLAQHANLQTLPLLRELVINYSDAVDANWRIIRDRQKRGDSLKWWLRATLVAAVSAILYLGVVYCISAYARQEVVVSDEAKNPPPASPPAAQPPAEATPPQAQTQQPSVLAKPQYIELGRSHQEEGTQSRALEQPAARPGQSKDKR